MANASNRLRKLAGKAAKRKAILADRKRAEVLGAGLGGKVALAALGPIERCLVATDIAEAGMGSVVITRRLPPGLLGYAFFLVDSYCLGVKDAFYDEGPASDFESDLEGQRAIQTFVPADPATARKLLRDAVAYAADIGLPPAKDYNAIERIFGTIDPGQSTETFVFGKDGKPFFVPGPNDSITKSRKIIETLKRRCGEGNWDAMVPLEGEPAGLLESDEDEDG